LLWLRDVSHATACNNLHCDEGQFKNKSVVCTIVLACALP
jgi:hypothetical protein